MSRAAKGVWTRKDAFAELCKIKAPTLVIVGEEDAALPLPNSQSLKEGITGAHLIIIPFAGHSSTIEEPEAVNRAIIAFFESIKNEQKKNACEKNKKTPSFILRVCKKSNRKAVSPSFSSSD